MIAAEEWLDYEGPWRVCDWCSGSGFDSRDVEGFCAKCGGEGGYFVTYDDEELYGESDWGPYERQ